VPREWQITVKLGSRPESPYLYTSYRPYPGANPVRDSTGTGDPGKAEEIRADLERRLRRQEAIKGQPTYAELAPKYIDSTNIKNTKNAWRGSNRRWDPRIGHLCLIEITEEHLIDFITDRREDGVSDSFIRADLGFLSGLFKWTGVRKARNPVLQLEIPLKLANSRVRFLLPEEEEQILNACGSEEHRLMIIFAIETGLRKCEQLAARPSQVHREQREILVPTSKNGKPRVVPLSARAMGVLDRLDELHEPDRPFLFRGPRTDHFARTQHFWGPVVAASGVEDICWHDLRHTFASRYLQDGGSLPLLQKVLGHSNIQVTMRYAHLVTEDLHRQQRALDTLRRKRQAAARVRSERAQSAKKLDSKSTLVAAE
jgi:integrase/recombinase XerD